MRGNGCSPDGTTCQLVAHTGEGSPPFAMACVIDEAWLVTATAGVRAHPQASWNARAASAHATKRTRMSRAQNQRSRCGLAWQSVRVDTERPVDRMMELR